MKNDELKALERMGGIDGELVEAAGSYKKKRNFGWLYAAAACLVLGVAVFAGSRLMGNKPINQTAEAGRATAEPAENTEAGRRIVYSNGNIGNEFIPDPGEVSISYPLHDIVFGTGEYEGSNEYDGCYFAVRIEISNPLYDVAAAREAEWTALCADPDCRRWEEDYNYWLNEVFFKLPPEERGEILQGHNESGEEQQALLNAEFEKYELTRMTAEELEACKEAYARKTAFRDRELGFTPEQIALAAERISGEAARLAALGFDVEPAEDGSCITGFLTREQIARFPADPVYGYYILWQGGDNVMDE